MLLTLAISGYRSLHEVILPLERFNVITSANGSGKSSLYEAIRLLADVTQGRIIGSLADAEQSAVYVLEKELGETIIPDCDPPPWTWPKR